MTFDFSSVRKQPIEFSRINKVLTKAWKTLQLSRESIKNSPDDCFALAYDSMLKTSLALMMSRGFRPKVQLGHHKTLVNFAQNILRNFGELTSTYERMRKTRNKIIYDDFSVSISQAENAVRIAEKYFQVVEDKIAKDNPQQKLWKP